MSRKSVNKRIQNTSERIDKNRSNAFKSRGGRVTVAHGSIPSPRSNSLPVITRGRIVDVDAYVDWE